MKTNEIGYELPLLAGIVVSLFFLPWVRERKGSRGGKEEAVTEKLHRFWERRVMMFLNEHKIHQSIDWSGSVGQKNQRGKWGGVRAGRDGEAHSKSASLKTCN